MAFKQHYPFGSFVESSTGQYEIKFQLWALSKVGTQDY